MFIPLSSRCPMVCLYPRLSENHINSPQFLTETTYRSEEAIKEVGFKVYVINKKEFNMESVSFAFCTDLCLSGGASNQLK